MQNASKEIRIDIDFRTKLVKTVLDKFQTLPRKLKPNANEWTVLSGVVLSSHQRSKLKLLCICCGTKCLPQDKADSTGLKLLDCHAEVLCRRSIVYILLQQIKLYKEKNNEKNMFIQENIEINELFSLKDGYELHLVCSELPCGEVSEKVGNRFTSARKVGSNGMYLKGGRSDLPVEKLSKCKSCWNKLKLWDAVGLQGALLADRFTHQIKFSSITSFQENFVVNDEEICFNFPKFSCISFAGMECGFYFHRPGSPSHRKVSGKSPAGKAIVWISNDFVSTDVFEVIIGKTGLYQQRKRKRDGEVANIDPKAASLLSKLSISNLFIEVFCKCEYRKQAYISCKGSCVEYRNQKLSYLKQQELEADWIDKSKQSNNYFFLQQS
eukprot:snap_masked-scaffold_49-processed-gene-0.18-mRNA-1 protein AED:1.00 eAED:1.00 QI:0/-1/0/0/-1/1/1/0/381